VRRSSCPSTPTTHPPYVPRPSALDHLDRDMLNPTSDLLSHWPPSCMWCPVYTSGALRTERGWVTAVTGAVSWVSAAATPCNEPGGMPWASSRVRRRVVPSKLFVYCKLCPPSAQPTMYRTTPAWRGAGAPRVSGGVSSCLGTSPAAAECAGKPTG
jgi:hypothetical protein